MVFTFQNHGFSGCETGGFRRGKAAYKTDAAIRTGRDREQAAGERHGGGVFAFEMRKFVGGGTGQRGEEAAIQFGEK